MHFPTKAKCREWLATFEPSAIVGTRCHSQGCPMVNFVRWVLGAEPDKTRVLPPYLYVHYGAAQEALRRAHLPVWARNIVVAVDMKRTTEFNVTAAEVAALLH